MVHETGRAMAIPRCEADHLTIVLIGNFNLSILQPRWLAGDVALLGPEEADAAKVTIIAPDAAIFDVGDWLGLQVNPERLQATGPSCTRAQDQGSGSRPVTGTGARHPSPSSASIARCTFGCWILPRGTSSVRSSHLQACGPAVSRLPKR